MPRVSTNRRIGGHASAAAILFLCLFASQAGLIALSPVLVAAAQEFGISTAAAGQLRTVSGVAAFVTALSVSRLAHRVGLGAQLLAGSALLALGSLASAAAPTFGLLALAQLPVGAGAAVLATAGTLAAAAWVPKEHRARVLSWALVGQPSAWIVGMPLIGIVGAYSWRLAWLVLPLTGALLAGAALGRRVAEPPAPTRAAPLRDALAVPQLRRWLAAEVLANTAWAGVLVYSGVLFVESYGSSTGLAGVALAIGAAAYVAGNLSLRRFVDRDPVRLLPALVLVLAIATTAFGALRPSPAVSTLLFSAAAFGAGGRTLISSGVALAAAPELRAAVMGGRTASMQFGHFAGSLAAGTALAFGGYAALGLVTGLLFVASAASLAPWPVREADCLHGQTAW